MSETAFPGWRGNSPINNVPRPSVHTVPSSVIAEIAAEARPTASGGKSRAATHQYAKPSTEVTAVVLTSEAAFNSKTLLALTHGKSDVFFKNEYILCLPF